MRIKIVILFIILSFTGWSQTTIFSENMGTPTGDTPIASNAFQNATPISFSGTAEVRITTQSDQLGASGSGNVFFTPSNATYFEISGINTSNYTNLTLTLGHYKNQNVLSNELIIEVSSDGINYTSLTYTRASGTGTSNWISITPSGSIPTTSNLRIRFRFIPISPTAFFRIDDLVLTGTLICPSTTSWNGTSWSNGTPDFTKAITFNGAFSSSADIEACSCKVNSGAVTINSGHSLKVTKAVTITGGSLTFENNASLVQTEDTAINSGNITYKRATTPVSNFDYTYWSTPVSPQTLYNVSPDTFWNKFHSYDSSIDNWVDESSANTMSVGKGYIIRGPQSNMAPAAKSAYVASFIGQPNNGAITTPIGATGSSNLIGNPYPSALDARLFLLQNLSVLDGTLYFWNHNTNIGTGVSNAGSGIYAYSSDDYASYNLTGGVATQAASVSSTNPGAVNTNIPSGKIASGQGFFATSIAPGSAVFNNSMRVGVTGVTGNNSQFFKMASQTKKAEAIEENRLWLNLTNRQGAFKQTLIGYVSGATNDYETMYDGISYDFNAFIDFYSMHSDKNLVIQGRALPLNDNDEVQLGYKTKVSGTFDITIDQADGLLATKDIYLEDKLTDTVHNLKNNPYSFTTETGTFNDRFVLGYTNKKARVLDDNESTLGLVVSTENNEIKIQSPQEPIEKVFVYSFSGKLLFKKDNIYKENYTIANLFNKEKVLILKVIILNGKSYSQKILHQ